MKPRFPVVAALGASLAILHGATASAASSGASSLSNVQLGAIDMTPDDGMAAGYSMNGYFSTLSAGFFESVRDWVNWEQFEPGQPGVVASGWYDSYADASTSGALGDVTSSAIATADLDDRGFTIGEGEQIARVTLRPHTVLTVSGHYTTMAERAHVGDFDYDATSRISVTVANRLQGTLSRAEYVSSLSPMGETYHALEGDFLIGFANGTDVDMPVTLTFSSFSKMNVLAPVPEPQAWLVLPAGLAVVGVIRRRRQAGTPMR